MRPRALVAACLAAVLLTLAACSPGEHRAARTTYNEGVTSLAKGEFDAAVKSLVAARSEAGVDPDLRFRAAYNLGLAYAGHADTVRAGDDADLARALDLAQHAASWLADAARLRPGDADTQANLAIVRARVQAISDELRKGEGRLEARLDALIDDQREVLEEARGAWLAIKRAGGADPLAQQGTLIHLADRERGVVAEAGVVGDLADDETAAIGRKPEKERSDEDASRVVQLENLGIYIAEARSRIGEARRKLQDLAAKDGVARAEAALVALKRAREQLLDPVTVLRGVARDEVALMDETLRAAGGTSIPAAIGAAGPGAEPRPPAWLSPASLAERQGGLRDRVEEVRARLAAFVEQKAGAAPDQPEDPDRAKLVERVSAALPPIAEASAAMERSRDALGADRTKPAIEHEQAALDALARAIEEFVDLKTLVELSHAQQQEVVALLSQEAAKELDPATRARRTKDGLARNLSRMGRLRELIAEERARVEEKTAQAAAPHGRKDGATDPEAAKREAEQAKEQIEQEKQMLTRAETLRAEAATALETLEKSFAANEDPVPPANEAAAKIEELRKLFFSVVEHLQQLIRDQGETRDRTSAANADDAATRTPRLPELAGREDEHGEMAQAILDALARQADAAQGTPPQEGAPDAKALAGAVEEMRNAGAAISGARDELAKARDAKGAGGDLVPVVKHQGTAIEHLEAALRLLQPPKDENKDKDPEEQQGEQGEAKPQEGAGEPSPAGGAAQRARDDDARRQRERRAREGRSEPVEKDW